MPKPLLDAPPRWADETGGARLPELFRAVSEPEPLSAARLARVHDRLIAARSTSRLPRRLREALLAAVMLVAGSSLAVASWGASEWLNRRTSRAPTPAAKGDPV